MEDNEEYLPIDEVDPKKIMVYTKYIPSEKNKNDDSEYNVLEQHRKICLLSSTDNDKCHKYCGFNKFTKKVFDTPSIDDGWNHIHKSIIEDYELDKFNNESFDDYVSERMKYHENWIKNGVFDPDAKMFSPKDNNSLLDKYKNLTMYQTLDNYNIGYIVFINPDINEVFVYGRTHDMLPAECDFPDECLFDNLIVKYGPLKIFIGKSVTNKMTSFSGGHGEKWDGNSILLRIGNTDEFRYVYIGTEIFEFVTEEEITAYVSSVGNNCVPYPYAESLNWCYCMGEKTKTPISDHPKREIKGNISYVKTASYQPFDITRIANRDTEYIRFPVSASEKTNMVKFIEPCKFSLIANSCNDETLPAVQHINGILEDH